MEFSLLTKLSGGNTTLAGILYQVLRLSPDEVQMEKHFAYARMRWTRVFDMLGGNYSLGSGDKISHFVEKYTFHSSIKMYYCILFLRTESQTNFFIIINYKLFIMEK